MTGEELDKLVKARDLIFEVEQGWRDDEKDKEYAADTLYKARIELNNAMSRG